MYAKYVAALEIKREQYHYAKHDLFWKISGVPRVVLRGLFLCFSSPNCVAYLTPWISTVAQLFRKMMVKKRQDVPSHCRRSNVNSEFGVKWENLPTETGTKQQRFTNTTTKPTGWPRTTERTRMIHRPKQEANSKNADTIPTIESNITRRCSHEIEPE